MALSTRPGRLGGCSGVVITRSRTVLRSGRSHLSRRACVIFGLYPKMLIRHLLAGNSRTRVAGTGRARAQIREDGRFPRPQPSSVATRQEVPAAADWFPASLDFQTLWAGLSPALRRRQAKKEPRAAAAPSPALSLGETAGGYDSDHS
jgi:hypothetical protein